MMIMKGIRDGTYGNVVIKMRKTSQSDVRRCTGVKMREIGRKEVRKCTRGGTEKKDLQ